jgi:inositol transport system substrate-binding protein
MNQKGKGETMKNIYILLTRTNTLLSRCIYAATRKEFTHVALCLDGSFREMYSFGRKYRWSYLPAGFVRESVHRGMMGASDDITCAVYRLSISNRSYQRLLRILNEMEQNVDKYRYNIIGLAMCFFCIAMERRRHFFCSQFVSHVLIESGAVHMEKTPSLVHPMDFPGVPGMEQIFSGSIDQLRCVM